MKDEFKADVYDKIVNQPHLKINFVVMEVLKKAKYKLLREQVDVDCSKSLHLLHKVAQIIEVAPEF